MVHQIVNLVVSVDQRPPVPGLRVRAAEVADRLLEVRQHADGLAGLDVLGARLRRADGLPGGELAVVEAAALAEAAQADRGRVDAVQLRQGADGIIPHLVARGRVHAGDGRVLDDAPVEELHDVEGRADDAVVLAQAVRFGHGHVRLLQRVDDAVLALDLVRRLGHQLAGGLLAHHEPLPRAVGELVGRIRLTKAELQPKGDVLLAICTGNGPGGRYVMSISRPYLLHVKRHLDLGHILLNVSLKGLDVDGLPDTPRHDDRRAGWASQAMVRGS